MKNIKKMFTADSKIYTDSKTTRIKEDRSLHRSLKWVLFVAQCFGQMPVLGITAADSRFLKFSWKSWKTFYCILNGVGSGFICGLFIYRIMSFGGNLYDISSVAFYLSTSIETITFLKLAKEWPQLMSKWASTEVSMRSYGWPRHLHTRITIMSFVVIILATVETTMVKISKLHRSLKCATPEEGVTELYFRAYLFPEIFLTIDYALWKSVVIHIVNCLATFVWTFNDLFIMLMSTALALRFKQVTGGIILLGTTSKVDTISMWREIRKDYNRLATLTRTVDEALSYIILTSFASNLFFILLQLFNSIRKMRDTLEKIYFFYSFGFLILRTICVTLYGAWVYDESEKPLSILNAVPSNMYNIEIKRFVDQVNYDKVALSGKNFFYITRGLLLSMAGAVVTYELVLIQFNGKLLQESAMQASNFSKEC